jgi:hypothetical protein
MTFRDSSHPVLAPSAVLRQIVEATIQMELPMSSQTAPQFAEGRLQNVPRAIDGVGVPGAPRYPSIPAHVHQVYDPGARNAHLVGHTEGSVDLAAPTQLLADLHSRPSVKPVAPKDLELVSILLHLDELYLDTCV